MAKDRKVYVCENCGQESLRWVGRCPSCQQWNTMKELVIREEKPMAGAARAALKAAGHDSAQKARPVPVAEIRADEEPRMDMGDRELNRVLGGGLVPGSLVLLGGEPGIGKSTLVLQTVLRLAGRRVLYVSGEESARQLKLRADRLQSQEVGQGGVRGGSDLLVLTETSLEQIFVQIEQTHPDLVVIDSIQTIQTEAVESSPGSLAQIRECAASLLKYAKCGGASILLIGHINKEGTLAGPKVLEHIVDTVLQFEGDQHYMYRILRSIKNRFGSTSELGIYEMRHDGLRQVANPRELLLTDNRDGLSGVAIACTVEGARPFHDRDPGAGQHGGLWHGTAQHHGVRRQATQYAAGCAGEESGLQVGFQGCVSQYRRRSAGHRPRHRPGCHSGGAQQQRGYAHRCGYLCGRRGGAER